MTRNQFEIINREHIFQNFSYEHDVFPELEKCKNPEIQEFFSRCKNEKINYKKDPQFVIELINEEFPNTKQYYKIQLFLSQIFMDIADSISISQYKKRTYEDFAEKYLEQSKQSEQNCESISHISYLLDNEDTDNNIIECEKNFREYNDSNFLLMKGNFESREKVDEALQTFKDGTKIFPDDIRFYNNLANMYIANDDFNSAYHILIDEIEHTIKETDFNKSIIFNNLGCTCSLMDKQEIANKYFSTSVLFNKKNFLAWYNAGIFHNSHNDIQKGVDCLKKAYTQNKTHPKIGIRYVLSLLETGQKTKGLAIFKSLENDDSEFFKQARRTIEGVVDKFDHNGFAISYNNNKSNLKIESKLKTLIDIQHKILQNLEKNLYTNHERDAQLFQRVVTAMQQHDTSTSRVLSNELAEIRKITKIIEADFGFISRINLSDLKTNDPKALHEIGLFLIRNLQLIIKAGNPLENIDTVNQMKLFNNKLIEFINEKLSQTQITKQSELISLSEPETTPHSFDNIDVDQFADILKRNQAAFDIVKIEIDKKFDANDFD